MTGFVMRNDKIVWVVSVLFGTSILALLFAFASTGVTGRTPLVYLAIICGFYGIFALPMSVVLAIVVVISRALEKRKK